MSMDEKEKVNYIIESPLKNNNNLNNDVNNCKFQSHGKNESQNHNRDNNFKKNMKNMFKDNTNENNFLESSNPLDQNEKITSGDLNFLMNSYPNNNMNIINNNNNNSKANINNKISSFSIINQRNYQDKEINSVGINDIQVNQNINLKDLINSEGEDQRNKIYLKSTENLLFSLKNSLNYFTNIQNNSNYPQGNNQEYKDSTVKFLTRALERCRNDKELLLEENKKLKEKIKILLKNPSVNNSLNISNLSKSNLNISNNNLSFFDDGNVPVNKLIESFMKLQIKYDALEKENNLLKDENDNLNKKILYSRNKYSDNNEKVERSNLRKYSPFTRIISTSKNSDSFCNNNLKTSQNNLNKDNCEMENVIKEQLKCMNKMLQIVQDGNNNQINEVRK